jgi:parvulin-like peptidyl-prolyl isomerase
MSSRQAIWGKLASLALLAGSALAANAQAPRVDPNVTPTSIITTNEKPAAVVNGEPVAMSEVKRLLDARPYPVSLTEEQKKGLRQAAVEMLVDDLLMRQYLRKIVPQVDPTAYAKEVQDLQEALKKQNKTIAQLVKESGQSEEQIRTDIVSRLQWRALLNQQCPEPTLRKYYDDNKVFFDKVLVRASHILVKVPATPAPGQREVAVQKLQQLRQEISAGKMDFAAAAQKYSDCPSKDKGGDIGPFPYKFVVVEPFAKAAFALKPGEMSDIVTTEFGVHLIKVTERTPGEPSSYDAMREMIREVWAQEAELYQRILTEQRKASKIDVYLQ